jgi:hypothetical protein
MPKVESIRTQNKTNRPTGLLVPVWILILGALGVLAAALLWAGSVFGFLTHPAPPASRVIALSMPVTVYSEADSPDNHYYPSGWMGDWGDLSVDESFAKNPHSGSTCIRIGYSAQGSNGAGWAGIYWQNPRNNWGGTEDGYDLRTAKKLIFWARGAIGGEKIDKFQVGGIQGRYPDSDSAGIGPVVLSAEWKEYVIDLTESDLSQIIGGFMFVANARMNPNGFVIHIDDVRFE